MFSILRFSSLAFFLTASFTLGVQASNDAPSKSPTAVNEVITHSHALNVYGNPKYAASFERFDYTSPKAVKGGRIKLAEIGTFDTTNPYTTKGVAIRNAGLVHGSLMTGSGDEPSTLYAHIAKQVSYSNEFNWISFTLNEKAVFSDGKPITAQDVKFTFEILTTKGDPAYKLAFQDVESVDVLKDNHVKFTLKQKNRDLLSSIAGLPVLAKHYWQDRDFEKTTLDVPVSSGPYSIAKLEAGRFVTYQRNPDYWARDLNVNNGVFNFDKVHVDYYRDTEVAFEAFKANNYDYHFELTSKTWATGYDISAVKNGDIQKLLIDDKRVQGMQATIFNVRQPLLQDIHLRQAISMAFDFEWTNKNIFYNAYTRTQSFFQNTPYQAQGKPSAAELALLTPFKETLPKAVFGDAFVAPVTDGSGNNRKVLREAKKLLTSAGYTVKQGQLYAPDGKTPIVLEMMERQKGLNRIINPWIANLKRLGIIVNLRFIDQTQWVNRLQDYDFELASLVYSGRDIPGNEQIIYWGSKSADTPKSSNYIGIKHNAVDSLTRAIVDASDEQSRIAAARALDRVLMHSHYVVPKYYGEHHRIAFWNKFSRPKTPTSYDFRHEYGIHTWWFDEAKAKKLNKQ